MNKKNKKMIVYSSIVSLILVFSISVFSILKDKGIRASASDLKHGVAQNYQLIDSTGAKGGDKNPFVILEIVPDISMAEIGYTIAGCEPVNIKKLEVSDEIKKLGTFGSAIVSDTKVTIKKYDLNEDDITSQWTYVTSDTITHKGYYLMVEDGKGKYKQKKVLDGENIIITYERDTSGNLVWITDDSLDLSLLPTTEDFVNPGDRVYKERTDNYYTCNRYEYQNKNLFLKNVLQLNDSQIPDYHVIVKTISPSELNSNSAWINRADLIYINSKSHSADLINLWNSFNLYGVAPRSAQVFSDANDLSWDAVLSIFNKTVINQERAGLIFDNLILTNTSNYSQKMVRNSQITYDGTKSSYLNSLLPGYSNNLYKLGIMTQGMNPRVFYNLYLSDHDGSTTPLVQSVNNPSLSKQTGSFVIQHDSAGNKENEELYWNAYTFLTCNKDGTSANSTVWNNMWPVYRYNYANLHEESIYGRIYSYAGNRSLVNVLLDGSVLNNGRYTESLSDYAATLGTSPSRSLAVQYICSSVSDPVEYKNSIQVLEVQPCSDFSLTDFRIRMLVPTFAGKVTITRQTTPELNGKIEDLNSKYDLIYMGMNTGKFNLNPTTKRTVYNDTNLNGYVYLHVGDKVTTTNYNQKMKTFVFSGMNSSEQWLAPTTAANKTVRFPGNDITKLKKQQLEEFLSADYPILVHNDLYGLKSGYIDTTSYISKFISENKASKTNLINENATNAAQILENYIRVAKPEIQLITQPVQYVGDTDTGVIDPKYYINGTGMSIDYRRLVYRFKINDGGLNDYYNVKLYVDKNADGKYSASECILTSPRQAGNLEHVLQRELGSSFVGVVPWKLQIVSQTNANRRSEVTGLSAIRRKESEKREIKILQINQKDGTGYPSTLNLEENYNNHQNFWKYTKDLNDFKIVFKTVKTNVFESWFNGGNAFNNTNDETKFYTDKLNTYDMIIFGFSDCFNSISNTNGALDNVFYFIDQGKSVLFTHDVTSYNTDSSSPNAFGYTFNTYFRDILGMDRFGVRTSVRSVKDAKDKATAPNGSLYPEIQGYTYPAIKRMANNSQRMSFAGLSFSDGNFHSTSVTKTNDGQITQYPYMIQDTINVANTHSQYFQLDLEDPELVVWYCLTGGTSNLYSVSPNDASNNYYIYNKGNITYSGVGHSIVNDSVMEVKLFVNTMVAAYKNTYSKPMIELTDTDSFLGSDIPSVDRNYFYYINSDADESAATEYQVGDKLYVTFVPIEYNLIAGNLGVKVSYTRPDGTEGICEVYKKSTGQKITTIFNGNPDYVQVESDETYYFVYDKSEFNSLSTQDFNMRLINSVGQNSNTLVRLIRRSLFYLK